MSPTHALAAGLALAWASCAGCVRSPEPQQGSTPRAAASAPLAAGASDAAGTSRPAPALPEADAAPAPNLAALSDAASAEDPSASTARAMVELAAGAFEMGDAAERDQRPVHRVALSAFALDRTEVITQAYEACVRAGACETTFKSRTCNEGRPERANDPINCVSAAHAESYCRWVHKRLPSEEEWEYAARGSEPRPFPWGTEPPDERVCWRRWKTRAGTCPVGSYLTGASAHGLLDMAGNVAEWTSSGFSTDYTKPRADKLRVCRGGSWGDVDARALSSTGRCRFDPAQRSDQIGFRCAR